MQKSLLALVLMAQQAMNNFTVRYTPKHGSWLDQLEFETPACSLARDLSGGYGDPDHSLRH